jgi:hypothetical protein
MTRFLSESLQAAEPAFRAGLNRLEAANGHPNTDIRFTAEVRQATQAKLRELGLDPHDTTAQELYHVLQERIKTDDARLNRVLRTRAATHISAEADVVAGMVHTLEELPDSKRSFALKPSVLKTLLKSQPPKKAMKQLGYRSLDSFLKHESPALILAAAWLSESAGWQRRWLEQYKDLKAADFEDRRIALLRPDSRRWQQLSASVVSQNQHNLLAFKEAAALVFLPLPDNAPPGTTTASLALALHQLNEIRAAGTFLKLCQVRPDFGRQVRTVADDETLLKSRALDRPVPWNLIQRHYAEYRSSHSVEAFEPHLRLEDIAWHPIEQTLAAIEPGFKFWQGSAHLGLLHQGEAVSLNLVDAALNFCNGLPFEQRVLQYYRHSLWNELLLRYLHHDAVEQTINDELQPALAQDTAEISV